MPEKAPTTRLCPFCKEEVNAGAVRCKHCQAAIPQLRPAHGGVCPFCQEDIHPEAIRCKHCKADLAPSVFIEQSYSGGMRSPFHRTGPAPRRMRRLAGQGDRSAAFTKVDPSGCPEVVMEGSSMWCLEYVEWEIDTDQTYCIYTECAIA